ncbi:MAG TPA: hypothetical protein VMU17_00195 [Elusimicrobiota bacterium]|nr:hypothetical protein [Elusimicrobiota bacterium]
MLDATAYRAAEIAGKRAIASWRLSNINDPYIFQNQGFPVRIESVLDLAQILDTMQEERFDYYMGEIGGLTDEEANFFADVCIDYIQFYQRTFQTERVIVPLSTMIAHYLIYRKLLGYNPQFSRLLELGPGCGYLSFFLRHHSHLQDYSQVESTESFYLLQSHINDHVFGARFSEHAISQRTQADQSFYISKFRWHGDFHYEPQKIINVARTVVCNHYPWWRLGDVAEKRYDIVASNANLNEFSKEALYQYLSVISDVLADDGAIIAQCLGGGAPTYPSVFERMKTAGFVPVVLVAGDADPRRIFVVSNAVFVGRKHPLYAEYADKAPQFPTWDRKIDFVDRMYFMNEEHSGQKRIRSMANILDLILQRTEEASATEGQHQAPAPAAPQLNGQKDPSGELAALLSATRLLQEKAALEQRVSQLAQQGDELQQRVSQIATQAQASAAEAAALRSSTSWRMTAPFRYLASTMSPFSGDRRE